MLLDFFKKRDRSVVVQPGGEKLVVPAGEKLLNAALDAGLAWPHDCRVGSCGKCRCVLKEGKIKPLADFSYTLEHDDITAGAILACQSQLKSDIVVEVELGDRASPVDVTTGVISRTDKLTHDIIALEVELEKTTFANTRAGQYFEISTSAITTPRSYSLAHRPDPSGIAKVDFAIRHVPGGEFTDWLFDADRLGEQLSVRGPFGGFYLRDPRRQMFCVAGGSGLAPIVALIEDGLVNKREEDCVVLFGARTQDDLYHIDLLTRLGEQWHADFQLVPVLSHENGNSSWTGARGLVTSTIASFAASGDFNQAQAYLCGPPGMIDAAIAEFERFEMPNEHIYFDKFLDASSMPSGRG